MTRSCPESIAVKALIALVLSSTTACTTMQPQSESRQERLASSGRESAAPSPASRLSEESLKALQEIEQEILKADVDLEQSEAAAAPKPPQHPRIPLEINENVRKWIHFFTVKDRERFHRFLKRGSAYKPLVQEILKKNGAPTELYYLAMIESGYVTHARSRASAVGIWQFMRGTGLRYGLKQNRYLDERRDVVRATEAAAAYLRNLHTAFQSWYLAMAGYNAGEGRILGAIMRGGSRDFWELVEKKALPPETRNYVPKFLAATLIGKNPKKYAFNDIDSPALPEVKSLTIPGGVSLRVAAARIGVPFPTLKTLNPQLIRGMTPANVRQYAIWIPKNASVDFERAQRQLAGLGHFRAHKPTARPVVHRVKRGEALTLIAARYRVPVKHLKRINDLRTNRIYAGQRLVISRGF